MAKRIDNTSCHCLRMRRSAQNVVDFYDATLAPAGVTARQYSLLNQVALNDGCSVSRLAELTELDRSTLARSLRPLYARGFLADVREDGARNKRLTLTAEGKRVHKEAASLWAEAQRHYEEHLGPERVRALESALELLQTL